MQEFTFEGNGEVESLATVPDKYHGLYVESEKDGKTVFSLTDAARPLVADYVGTNVALASARGDKTKASGESANRRVALNSFTELLQTLGLEDTTEGGTGAASLLGEYITDLTGKAKNGDEMKINLDKVRRQMTAASDEALAAKDAIIATKDSALSTHLIGDIASRALAEAKGSPELLLPIVRANCKVVEVDGSYQVRVVDAQGDFRTDGAGGFMGVKELVAELKTNDAYARAFESETNSGGGKGPGSDSTRNLAGSTKDGKPLSANEKIAAGLSKGQFTDGRGQRGRM